jgi:hypothetical protein
LQPPKWETKPISLSFSKSTLKLRISHKLPLFIVGAALVTAPEIGKQSSALSGEVEKFVKQIRAA